MLYICPFCGNRGEYWYCGACGTPFWNIDLKELTGVREGSPYTLYMSEDTVKIPYLSERPINEDGARVFAEIKYDIKLFTDGVTSTHPRIGTEYDGAFIFSDVTAGDFNLEAKWAVTLPDGGNFEYSRKVPISIYDFPQVTLKIFDTDISTQKPHLVMPEGGAVSIPITVELLNDSFLSGVLSCKIQGSREPGLKEAVDLDKRSKIFKTTFCYELPREYRNELVFSKDIPDPLTIFLYLEINNREPVEGKAEIRPRYLATGLWRFGYVEMSDSDKQLLTASDGIYHDFMQVKRRQIDGDYYVNYGEFLPFWEAVEIVNNADKGDVEKGAADNFRFSIGTRDDNSTNVDVPNSKTPGLSFSGKITGIRVDAQENEVNFLFPQFEHGINLNLKRKPSDKAEYPVILAIDFGTYRSTACYSNQDKRFLIRLETSSSSSSDSILNDDEFLRSIVHEEVVNKFDEISWYGFGEIANVNYTATNVLNEGAKIELTPNTAGSYKIIKANIIEIIRRCALRVLSSTERLPMFNQIWISSPTQFSPALEEVLKNIVLESVNKLGLSDIQSDNIRVLDEGQAALYYFVLRNTPITPWRKDADEVVAVWDFGGGTTDIVVIVNPVSGTPYIIGLGGDPEFGGKHVDGMIYDSLTRNSRETVAEEHSLNTITKFKEMQSDVDYLIKIFYGRESDKNRYKTHINKSIREVNLLIKNRIQRIFVDLLKNNPLVYEQLIDTGSFRIVLSGGSSPLLFRDGDVENKKDGDPDKRINILGVNIERIIETILREEKRDVDVIIEKTALPKRGVVLGMMEIGNSSPWKSRIWPYTFGVKTNKLSGPNIDDGYYILTRRGTEIGNGYHENLLIEDIGIGDNIEIASRRDYIEKDEVKGDIWHGVCSEKTPPGTTGVKVTINGDCKIAVEWLKGPI